MTKTTLAHFGFKILAVAGIVLCLPLLLMSASVMAQTTNGRFVITVKDPSGAIVPGATVTVTNDGTKQEVTGTTNEGGVYTTPLLPVGLYSLTTEASGFKKSISEKLKLDIAQEYGFTVDLQVGGNDEIVVVQAGGEELVQTTNGEVRNTVSSKQTQELPLQTRNPLNLVQLQAGVNGNLSRTTTVINGQRASTAQVTKDGINIQDNFIRSNGLDFSPNLPTVANVGEVTIITQNAGADVAGSSAVRFVTPSGTNEYHGEAFLFNRNSAVGSNDFFNNLSGVEKPQLNRNQFGYRIGGPIFKNKLFFFNSYEGIRQREGAQLTATNLLGDARQGIFTYRDNSGQIRKFNILAARGIQIDPVVAGLIAQAPTDTNLATVGDGLNTSGFLFNRSQPFDRNTYSTRIDWNINSRHSINGIYEYANENIARGDIDTSFNRTLQVLQTGRTHFLKGGWNFAVNNRLANEVGVGYNFTDPQFDNIQNPTGFFAGGATVAGLFTNPAVTFLDQGRTTRYTSIFDRASLSLGKHSLQFGFQYDRIRITPFNDAGILPTFNLGQQNFPTGFAFRAADFPGGIDATQLLTANNFLALYSGSIATANVTFNATNQSSGFVRGATQRRKLEIDQYAFYVTDQFRIHPRVTINAGLRYDYITPLREQNNFALLPERGGAADGRSIVLNPNGRVNFANGFLFDPDRNNFAPNIAVAWDVPGLGKRQTVLRGGYSIAYVNDESVRAIDNSILTNQGLSTTVAPPAANLIIGGVTPRLGTSVGNILAGPLAAPPFRIPITFAQQFAINPGSAFGTPTPGLITPYIQQYNFGIERELTNDMVLTVRYVGNHSTTLVRGQDFNQIDVMGTGFAADVARARQNGFLALASTGVFDPRFNPNISGSQQLSVFPQIAGGGLLTNATVRNIIQTGEAASLAQLYITNNLTGNVRFTANPNTLAANVLLNNGTSTYNALQVEIRRRFSNSKIGTYAFQANYTYSKTLVNTSGDGQTRFEALLDNGRPALENARAPFDVPHAFKANFLYELPFGAGKTFNPSNKVLNKVVSGFQITSIIEVQTGVPFSITSNRGTFNRVGRGINTAFSSLDNEQIKDLLGVFKTPNGIFFIDPKVIGPDGRGVAPDGRAPFAGQVFFNPGSGDVGALQRLAFNGPTLYNLTFGIIKRTAITERINTEFRTEFFNAFNNTVFNFGIADAETNINSTNFGRIRSTFIDPRVIQFAFKVSF